MKALLGAIFTGIALAASAEPPPNGEPLGSQTSRSAQGAEGLLETPKPNQIQAGSVTYSGSAVQIVKTDNPFQLISPFAPLKYGSAEDNLMRDPISGKQSGLKFLSISF